MEAVVSGHRSFSTPAAVERVERTIVDQIGFSRVLDSLPEIAVEVVPSPAMMRGGAQRLVDRPACEERANSGRPSKIPGRKKKLSLFTRKSPATFGYYKCLMGCSNA